jgi:hypothetical protein
LEKMDWKGCLLDMVLSMALRGDMGREGLERLSDDTTEGARGDTGGVGMVVGLGDASMLSIRGMEEA